MNIEEIKVGDVVFCEKHLDAAFSGPCRIVDNAMVPVNPQHDCKNTVKFYGKVYSIVGNILNLDLDAAGGAASVHFKHVTRNLGDNGEVVKV